MARIRLKEHIWVARQHMEFEAAADVIDDLALIDAELQHLGNMMPTAQAHRHLKNARAALLEEDSRAAARELEHLEASLVLTEFDLPLAASEQQILAAQEALAKNEPAAADRHLAAAEESIQFITLGGTAPLAGARMHLDNAAKNYDDKYYSAAREDLSQAIGWLHRAESSANEKSRKEMQKLADEISALKDRLDDESASHAHTLENFLHRSTALIAREAEELWLRYKRQQAENHTLRKLLDAKTHLFYAEHDLARNRNLDKVREEIRSTDGYLQEALRDAEPL